jgi:hypothetical protein
VVRFYNRRGGSSGCGWRVPRAEVCRSRFPESSRRGNRCK